MPDSASDSVTEEMKKELPKKVWPTRLNSKRYYVAMVLLYIAVGLFAFVSPIKEYAGVDESFMTVPLDLLVAYIFLALTVRYFWRAEKARKGTWYEIHRDKIVRKDGFLSKEFKEGVMSEELKEDPILNVMTNSRHWRYHTRDIPYSMVERVDLHQNLSERIMNIGNIKIDTGEDEIWMMRIPQAKQVEELINTLVSDSTERYYRDRSASRGYGQKSEARVPGHAPPERRK